MVLYVTHEQLEWDPDLDDGKTHVAQLKVGAHVVLEARFYAASGYNADEEAAEAIGRKAQHDLRPVAHTATDRQCRGAFDELKGQVSRLIDAANDDALA
jgi:hypothetical protein